MARPPRDPFDEDNGILGEVPGETVAAACRLLPPPETAAPDARPSAEIDGPAWVGRVRITFRRHRWKHGKAHMTSWVAVHAARI
jgi:hypothetical protein